MLVTDVAEQVRYCGAHGHGLDQVIVHRRQENVFHDLRGTLFAAEGRRLGDVEEEGGGVGAG